MKLNAILRRNWRLACLLVMLNALTSAQAWAADFIVYGDSLSAGWEDWSWNNTTLDFSSTATVHTGAKSLSVTYTQSFAGVKLHADAALNASLYDSLSFWVHGGA